MPATLPCPLCTGPGEVWAGDVIVRCPRCRGKGSVCIPIFGNFPVIRMGASADAHKDSDCSCHAYPNSSAYCSCDCHEDIDSDAYADPETRTNVNPAACSRNSMANASVPGNRRREKPTEDIRDQDTGSIQTTVLVHVRRPVRCEDREDSMNRGLEMWGQDVI